MQQRTWNTSTLAKYEKSLEMENKLLNGIVIIVGKGEICQLATMFSNFDYSRRIRNQLFVSKG